MESAVWMILLTGTRSEPQIAILGLKAPQGSRTPVAAPRAPPPVTPHRSESKSEAKECLTKFLLHPQPWEASPNNGKRVGDDRKMATRANHLVTINTAIVLVGLGCVDADVVDRLVSCYNFCPHPSRQGRNQTTFDVSNQLNSQSLDHKLTEPILFFGERGRGWPSMKECGFSLQNTLQGYFPEISYAKKSSHPQRRNVFQF